MDNYQLIEQIGEGSFGRVYKGRRKYTGQIVAMKFIPKRGKNKREIRNLRQEITILKSLNHENIIMMLDSFESDKEFCVVMEHAQGDLYEILESDGKLPEDVVKSIAKQLVRALHYLHSHRIIHRDMKPQNILIAPDGIVKLCDFGFARCMSNNTMVVTSIKGTPLYMAPELVQEQPYNRTADLWSLGVILYELHTGVPPFNTKNFYTLIQKIINNPVKYPKSISKEFKSFLEGLLNKEPKKRLDWPDLAEHEFVRETDDDRQMREKNHARSLNRKRINWFHTMVNGKEGVHHLPVPDITKFPYNGGNPPAQANADADGKASESAFGSDESISRLYDMYIVKKLDIGGMMGNQDDFTSIATFIRTSTKRLKPRRNGAGGVEGTPEVPNIKKALHLLKKALVHIQQTNSHYANVVFESNAISHMIQAVHDMMRCDSVDACKEISDTLKVIGEALKCSQKAQTASDHVSLLVPRVFTIVNDLVTYRHDAKHSVKLNTLKCLSYAFIHMNMTPTANTKLFKECMESNVVESVVSCMNVDALRGASNSGALSESTRHKLLSSTVKCLAELTHPMSGETVGLPTLSRKNRPQASLHLNYKHDKMRELTGRLLASNPQRFHLLCDIFRGSNDADSLRALRVIFQSARFSSAFSERLATLENLKFMVPHLINRKKAPTKVELIHMVCALMFEYTPQVIQPILGNIDNLLISVIDNFCSTTNVVLQCCILQILSRLARYSADINTRVMDYFMQSESFTVCIKLLKKVNFSKIAEEDKPRIEGTGYADSGYLDGMIFLFAEFSNILNEEFVRKFFESGTWGALRNYLLTLDTHSEISILGLQAVHKLIFKLADFIPHYNEKILCDDTLVQDFFIPCIREATIQQFSKWPESRNGGMRGVSGLVERVVNVLFLGFTSPSSSQNVQKFLFKQDVVRHVLSSLQYISQNTYDKPLSFLSRLVFKSPHFAVQFVKFASPMLIQKLLHEDNPPSLLIEILVIISQLARIKSDHYSYIAECRIGEQICKLLKHDDPGVRSKTCNLVGNMCRHNDDFYRDLIDYSILDELIARCRDIDPTTRKFACFAIGNAGFHNNSLYPQLQASIAPLIELLSDEEEKTRANAAGALGNLVRNSDELCDSLISSGAVDRLMDTLSDRGPNARKIALFSLGNFCVHAQCRRVLEGRSFRRVIQRLEAECRDDTIKKYIDRINRKMGDQ
uniref:non-specific serine/threonine protein kinase n=1 Tax=Percolomonas cosmopolitus TaxID=63605 RepID=A0A7S1KQZ9_9EUKA|mmetsp:Transcript_5462/g.20424  ORF Transcript_5462/g.20424 Transcript_5462/m.20424 type:complete len:1203 (+) Transcript_5462:105-3713(+)|eukprot:CAMPEP_0117441750 /NCGR_PEP_ID=MMETSP0759-20121206/3794_1 /TAXON_ID=63605 /ORGANISM="Percolomonas cosmopolitus, Strain WS" /LENGTH=1202 /DNA_ID=CAMNT_0005233611 /DNA_START=105 /DNA_END=3713 /DNA_ORIENTATION=+